MGTIKECIPCRAPEQISWAWTKAWVADRPTEGRDERPSMISGVEGPGVQSRWADSPHREPGCGSSLYWVERTSAVVCGGAGHSMRPGWGLSDPPSDDVAQRRMHKGPEG